MNCFLTGSLIEMKLLWRITRDSAVSFSRDDADISRDEVVGCWSNQDEVVEVVVMDHRLLLGERSFVVAPGEGCNTKQTLWIGNVLSSDWGLGCQSDNVEKALC